MALQIEQLVSKVDPQIDAFKKQFRIDRATRLLAANSDGNEVGFIDVVMEGGGVKGIATAGALYTLEKLGFRFRKVAGTSAGAICAALVIAAGKDALDTKSDVIIKILSNMDFYSFVDGGSDAKALLNSYNEAGEEGFFKNILHSMRKGISIIRNINDLVGDLGINPGNEFKAFITNKMESLNDYVPFTVSELKKKLERHLPRLNGEYQIKNNFTPQDFEADFQVVVTDVSYRRKTIFPRESEYYFHDPDQILVGDFVRASMSIPIFFEPFRMLDFSTSKENLKAPAHVLFVDGGLISNFPLSIFDRAGKPRCPTFGLLIDENRGKKPQPIKVDNLFELGLGMFDTTMEYGDKAYIQENPHARARIFHITNVVESGKQIKTTEFDLEDADKISLFENGVRAVLDKLKTWDFEEYIQKYRS
ncbi:MAG: patatin-like phospholipase family protein [Calditrichia bacterium]